MPTELQAETQCRQIVRAGHRCPYRAKRDGFCDNHWRMRYGHQYEMPELTCKRCNLPWRPGRGSACLMSPYIDQPPSVYPEPSAIRNEDHK